VLHSQDDHLLPLDRVEHPVFTNAEPIEPHLFAFYQGDVHFWPRLEGVLAQELDVLEDPLLNLALEP